MSELEQNDLKCCVLNISFHFASLAFPSLVFGLLVLTSRALTARVFALPAPVFLPYGHFLRGLLLRLFLVCVFTDRIFQLRVFFFHMFSYATNLDLPFFTPKKVLFSQTRCILTAFQTHNQSRNLNLKVKIVIINIRPLE